MSRREEGPGGEAFKLSPSDFAFLWEECKRCFYLKVRGILPRPRTAMPRIFTSIDTAMKEHFEGVRTEEIDGRMPPGVVEFSDRWVESLPISLPGWKSSCFIRGKFDTILRLDDGTFAVVDFKTSTIRSEHVAKYSRQLHAYATCLENAVPGEFALETISTLGLLVFEPDSFSQDGKKGASLSGSVEWMEIPRDDGAFLEFLGSVVNVLNQESAPKASSNCEWCRYREEGRRTGL